MSVTRLLFPTGAAAEEVGGVAEVDREADDTIP